MLLWFRCHLTVARHHPRGRFTCRRGLDPDKRSQFGVHYTDRDKIMRIVEPVIVRPLLAEWETAKAGVVAMMERADAARSPAARTRLRRFTVLALACGSGNFLYLALHALKDIEHPRPRWGR